MCSKEAIQEKFKPFGVLRTLEPLSIIYSNWVGNLRVTGIISDFVVEFEHLLKKSVTIVHLSRIKHNEDALVGNPVQFKSIAELTDRDRFFVDKLKDIRDESENFEVLVKIKSILLHWKV